MKKRWLFSFLSVAMLGVAAPALACMGVDYDFDISFQPVEGTTKLVVSIGRTTSSQSPIQAEPSLDQFVDDNGFLSAYLAFIAIARQLPVDTDEHGIVRGVKTDALIEEGQKDTLLFFFSQLRRFRDYAKIEVNKAIFNDEFGVEGVKKINKCVNQLLGLSGSKPVLFKDLEKPFLQLKSLIENAMAYSSPPTQDEKNQNQQFVRIDLPTLPGANYGARDMGCGTGAVKKFEIGSLKTKAQETGKPLPQFKIKSNS